MKYKTITYFFLFLILSTKSVLCDVDLPARVERVNCNKYLECHIPANAGIKIVDSYFYTHEPTPFYPDPDKNRDFVLKIKNVSKKNIIFAKFIMDTLRECNPFGSDWIYSIGKKGLNGFLRQNNDAFFPGKMDIALKPGETCEMFIERHAPTRATGDCWEYEKPLRKFYLNEVYFSDGSGFRIEPDMYNDFFSFALPWSFKQEKMRLNTNAELAKSADKLIDNIKLVYPWNIPIKINRVWYGRNKEQDVYVEFQNNSHKDMEFFLFTFIEPRDDYAVLANPPADIFYGNIKVFLGGQDYPRMMPVKPGGKFVMIFPGEDIKRTSFLMFKQLFFYDGTGWEGRWTDYTWNFNGRGRWKAIPWSVDYEKKVMKVYSYDKRARHTASDNMPDSF